MDAGYNETTIRKGDYPSAIDTSYGFRCSFYEYTPQAVVTPTKDAINSKGLQPNTVFVGDLVPISTKVGNGKLSVGKIPYTDNATYALVLPSCTAICIFGKDFLRLPRQKLPTI